MIAIYPYERLGQHDFGWLNAHYHFSFAGYRNPERMGFGALRVINDDIIKVGAGFDTHPHRDMEIITFVRKGAITHRDNLDNEGRTEAGNVQVMSAGTGVLHAEYNVENEDTRLYQIWIVPREKGVAPRWETRAFPQAPVVDRLNLLVSGREEDRSSGALYIHQDAAIYGGLLAKGTALDHEIENQAYILASEGRFTVDGQEMNKGDGAEVTGQDRIAIKAQEDAEILVIDIPFRA